MVNHSSSLLSFPVIALSDEVFGRVEQDHSRSGDRNGYRGGPRREGGDKGGAPADFQPAFRVNFMCYIPALVLKWVPVDSFLPSICSL